MFGSERREAERKATLKAERKEFIEYTGMKKGAVKLYFETSPRLSMRERREWWDEGGKTDYNKLVSRTNGLVEFFKKKEEFRVKLATIPALLEKPNLKKLAEVIAIQHEYITYLNETHGRSGAGVVVDSNFTPQDE